MSRKEELIRREIDEVEREKGVRVLFAVESGSRAWEIASDDSDYDVRFVYVRGLNDYLRLEDVRDTIEWRLDEVLDIVGWDLKKYLRLLRKSNPTAIEWLSTPLVYRELPEFTPVRTLAQGCYSRLASMHHYLGMARGEASRISKGEDASAKTYLYAVRAILAARWSLDEARPAPMSFQQLCAAKLEPSMRGTINGLLSAKRDGGERLVCGRIPELDRWIAEADSALMERARSLDRRKQIAWDELDEVFRLIVLRETT